MRERVHVMCAEKKKEKKTKGKEEEEVWEEEKQLQALPDQGADPPPTLRVLMLLTCSPLAFRFTFTFHISRQHFVIGPGRASSFAQTNEFLLAPSVKTYCNNL